MLKITIQWRKNSDTFVVGVGGESGGCKVNISVIFVSYQQLDKRARLEPSTSTNARL
jgi:hypothetical protein